jgi:uncharacterized protein YdaL
MVRLEDVGAMVSVEAMKTLSDYLASKRQDVPFSVAVIPRYVDGLGRLQRRRAAGSALSQATNLQKSLNYARSSAAARW